MIRRDQSDVLAALPLLLSCREAVRATTSARAHAAGGMFAGFWLDAPEATPIDRAHARGAGVSDADARVIALQRAQDAGVIAVEEIWVT